MLVCVFPFLFGCLFDYSFAQLLVLKFLVFFFNFFSRRLTKIWVTRVETGIGGGGVEKTKSHSFFVRSFFFFTLMRGGIYYVCVAAVCFVPTTNPFIHIYSKKTDRPNIIHPYKRPSKKFIDR